MLPFDSGIPFCFSFQPKSRMWNKHRNNSMQIFSSQLMLRCLSLSSIINLVWYLWVRSGTYCFSWAQASPWNAWWRLTTTKLYYTEQLIVSVEKVYSTSRLYLSKPLHDGKRKNRDKSKLTQKHASLLFWHQFVFCFSQVLKCEINMETISCNFFHPNWCLGVRHFQT